MNMAINDDPAPATPDASRPIDPPRAERLDQIPWGYGKDRVTAMAVDPDRLFVYWEVLDESLEAARRKLGAEAEGARTTLRIYDTTGRLFDGRNAHSHFDQEVQRGDRQWFCDLNKPTSSAHVEIGLLAPSGRFEKITRSGRVDFPRKDLGPPGPVEWMSVTEHTVERTFGSGPPPPPASFDAPPSGDGGQGPSNGQGEIVTEVSGEQVDALSSYEVHERLEWSSQGVFERVSETEWLEASMAGSVIEERLVGELGELLWERTSWQASGAESSWEAGPFSWPVEVTPPSREQFVGDARVVRVGPEVRVLHGPWQVVIRGIGARAGHRVLSRWEVRHTWTSVSETSVDPALPGRRLGSSDLRALSASELRLRGASEVFFLAASERRFLGATETRFMGATRFMAKGASERRFAGASERRFAGASERRLAGASELRLYGASERRFAGASERRFAGASDQRFLGASDQRAPAANGKSVSAYNSAWEKK